MITDLDPISHYHKMKIMGINLIITVTPAVYIDQLLAVNQISNDNTNTKSIVEEL